MLSEEKGDLITNESGGNLELETTYLERGESKFFHISPTTETGGKILRDETIGAKTLNPQYGETGISIEEGAELTITDTYTVNGDIHISSGGRIRKTDNE